MQIIVIQPLPRIDPPETEKLNPTLLIMTDADVYCAVSQLPLSSKFSWHIAWVDIHSVIQSVRLNYEDRLCLS